MHILKVQIDELWQMYTSEKPSQSRYRTFLPPQKISLTFLSSQFHPKQRQLNFWFLSPKISFACFRSSHEWSIHTLHTVLHLVSSCTTLDLWCTSMLWSVLDVHVIWLVSNIPPSKYTTIHSLFVDGYLELSPVLDIINTLNKFFLDLSLYCSWVNTMWTCWVLGQRFLVS